MNGTARRLAAQARPPGSLGMLEALAVRLAAIQRRDPPRAQRALLLVFAGDHGLVAEGVAAYPASVTAAMVRTLLAGRASANALARAVGVELRVVDAGIDAELSPHPALVAATLRRGAGNSLHGPALTPAEVARGLAAGAALARDAAAAGYDALLLGEMGIGNSSAAALLAHRLAPAPLADCVGPGAGHDAAGLARKHAVLAAVAARSAATEPHAVLGAFGGCEIVMLAGAVLGAAGARLPVVIDGFIVGAAALAAIRIDPAARDVCVFAHRSAEPGHAAVLAALGGTPLLDLGLRLGEGTGALLAWPLLRAAAALAGDDVATLADVAGAAVAGG